MVHEVLGRIAGQQDVQAREALAGVRGPGELADLVVEGVELRLRVGRGALRGRHGGGLTLEDYLRLVQLLRDDPELVVGFSNELMDHVLEVKAAGMRSLLGATAGDPLKVIAVYTSVAGPSRSWTTPKPRPGP